MEIGPLDPGSNEVLVLSQNGNWISNGSEITHEATIRGFNRHIRRDEQGYFLQIGTEIKRFKVEDTAYFVTALHGDIARAPQISLNDGSCELLEIQSLRYSPGRLICSVKQGKETARFLSSAYYEILSRVQEEKGDFFLQFGDLKMMLLTK